MSPIFESSKKTTAIIKIKRERTVNCVVHITIFFAYFQLHFISAAFRGQLLMEFQSGGGRWWAPSLVDLHSGTGGCVKMPCLLKGQEDAPAVEGGYVMH